MSYRISLSKEQHGDTIRLEKQQEVGKIVDLEKSETVAVLAIVKDGREILEALRKQANSLSDLLTDAELEGHFFKMTDRITELAELAKSYMSHVTDDKKAAEIMACLIPFLRSVGKDWPILRSIIRVRTKPFREPENIPQMVTEE